MNPGEQANEDAPPIGLAGVAGLIGLSAVGALLQLLTSHVAGRWAEWLFPVLFVTVPTAVAFLILYRSSWHREFCKARRILFMTGSAGLVFGADLLVAGLMMVILCLVIGLTRSLGGN